jgi:hypothetical protein
LHHFASTGFFGEISAVREVGRKRGSAGGTAIREAGDSA